MLLLRPIFNPQGENAKKDTYLQHARIGLSNSTVPPNLQLIIDHLDYDNRTSLRPDTRRLLHDVSLVSVFVMLISLF